MDGEFSKGEQRTPPGWAVLAVQLYDWIRALVMVILILLGGALIIASRAAQRDIANAPITTEVGPLMVAVALALHLVGIGMLGGAILLLRRTRHGNNHEADSEHAVRARGTIGALFITYGVIAALAAVAGAVFRRVPAPSGELAFFDSITLVTAGLFAVIGVLVGMSLRRNKVWSTKAAAIATIPVSFGFPLGTGLALYTWWKLPPAAQPEVE
jgi:hypothetical protein